METKIIKAVFGGSRYTVTAKRTRTDYGQVLEISGVDLPYTFECIFSNSSTSAGVGKKQIGSAQRVLIPDEYLATGQTIYAWVLVHDGEGDGRHMYSIKIPVDDMPDTSPEEPTPVEQSVISQAITALNAAVDTTAQKAQEASASADRAEHAAEGVEAYVERAEAAQSASESARDIALEAKFSAQASAATTSEKASEAISSATTASQSALTAEGASESAQEYATASAESASASAESASQASEHASTAGSKATEASGYANNANASAQTASQKASEASQSASIASARAIEADTAAGASIDAKNDAVTAQTAAQTAKTQAETARDEAQDIVDSISGKVEQIDSNTERIESLEDDRYKPYPTDIVSGSVASFPDGADDIPLKSCIVQVEPVQEGSGDPSPDNVRPITGWTGVEVTKCGKNLLNADDIVGGVLGPNGVLSTQNVTINSKGDGKVDWTSSITWRGVTSGYIEVRGGHAYKLSLAETPSYVIYAWYAKDKSFMSRNTHSGDAFVSVTAPDGAMYLRITIQQSVAGTFSYNNLQLELGSIATDYEPYSGQTYDITFPSEAGIVYGAHIDVLNGELVVDRAMVDLGTLNWIQPTISTFRCPKPSNAKVAYLAICSNYKFVGQSSAPGAYCIASDGSGAYVIVNDPTYTDAATFKTAMSGVQLCYELAEPIRYALPSQEIKTLLGQNNIWSNASNVSVEYRADPELYIEKTKPVVNIDDVQIDGTSVVTDGVANIPIAGATNAGLVKVDGYGLQMQTNKIISVRPATPVQIKAGVRAWEPIVPGIQHQSVFYGLAKAAGYDEKDSTLPMGEYTEEAKIAIQKMLGIYEAPWELIREDTFTNAEEADHIITTDANGESFELTDALCFFETPEQNNESSKGFYGQIVFRGNSDYISVECGAWTQAANSAAHGCAGLVENKDSFMYANALRSTTTSNGMAEQVRYGKGLTSGTNGIYPIIFNINSVTIRAVKGTGHYRLYGRRKWQ